MPNTENLKSNKNLQKSYFEFYKPIIKSRRKSLWFCGHKPYLKLRGKVKTIAVHKSGGGLGDLIQAIPFFRNLRYMFPDAKIIYLGLYQRPFCDSIFKNIPYIDEYIEYKMPGNESTFKEYFNFWKKHFNKFDLLIDTQSKFPPGFWLWLLNPNYFLSRSPFFSHWKFILNPKKKFHVAGKMLFLLQVLGLEDIDSNPAGNIEKSYLSFTQGYLKKFSGPFISILPTAGHPYKMWPKEKFALLADKFYSLGYEVILAGASSEEGILKEVAEIMKNKPIIPLVDEPKFGKDPIYSASLFKSSLITIGNDCGGLNLATFAGCPVIGIYGPTTATKSGPLGNKNIVIHKGMDCSPCKWFLQNCNMDRKCLKDITVEQVFTTAKELLNKLNPHLGDEKVS
ncbi:glycosyltransferase family 9 protein [Candidatus Babeliales bacterium]|nr:glycosyltransferase family 9 protein [Candidatus Babeliales bacterium]